MLNHVRRSKEHPLVRHMFPDGVDGVLRLWDERAAFLNALDRLPRTFCHVDALRHNLFPQRGREEAAGKRPRNRTMAFTLGFSLGLLWAGIAIDRLGPVAMVGAAFAPGLFSVAVLALACFPTVLRE